MKLPFRISVALTVCFAVLCPRVAWTQLPSQEEAASKPERIMIAPDVIFVAQDTQTSHGGWYVAGGLAIVVLMVSAIYIATFRGKNSPE